MVADLEWITCLEKRPVDRTGEDLDIILARLKDVKAFERFHAAVLQEICYYGYYHDLEKGITLFRQGDIGTNFYAVLSGTLDVNVSETGRLEDAVTLCVLGPGKIFGKSVLDDTPRHSTIITSEFCELIRVKKNDFKIIWERNKQHLESVIYTTSSFTLASGKQERKRCEINNNAELLPRAHGITKPVAHVGMVLRSMLLTTAPHLIRDHEVNLTAYRRCCVGSELVGWLLDTSRFVHTRSQAIGIWQALLEEKIILQVCSEFEFQDKQVLYQFAVDQDTKESIQEGDGEACTFTEEDFRDSVLSLSMIGPDAVFRMALRKPSNERTPEDLDVIFEELLHITALSHLSTRVKRELTAAFVFEMHANKGTVCKCRPWMSHFLFCLSYIYD